MNTTIRRPRRVRRPINWRIMELEELEGTGITDRAEQARTMGVSLAQLDRVRRAARQEEEPSARRRVGKADAWTVVPLGVRVPAAIVERVKSYSSRMGISAALVTAIALDDWLAGQGVGGPSGLPRNFRQRLGLR